MYLYGDLKISKWRNFVFKNNRARNFGGGIGMDTIPVVDEEDEELDGL